MSKTPGIAHESNAVRHLQTLHDITILIPWEGKLHEFDPGAGAGLFVEAGYVAAKMNVIRATMMTNRRAQCGSVSRGTRKMTDPILRCRPHRVSVYQLFLQRGLWSGLILYFYGCTSVLLNLCYANVTCLLRAVETVPYELCSMNVIIIRQTCDREMIEWDMILMK